MDKEKESEEMATIIEKSTGQKIFTKLICNGEMRMTLGSNSVAIDLLKAGYGNVKQAVKEFVEKLKETVKNMKVGEDEDYLFKAGFETLQEHLPEEIDKTFKELYGAD